MRSHMKQLGLALFLSCTACSIVFSHAAAQNYMPLDPGTQWIYGSPTGPERDTVVAVGPAVFDGVNVIELRYRGFNNGLSNFWTVSADGTVSFHGFDRPAESFAYHYIPPIRFVHPPVEVGATWRDTVLFHCVRDCSGGDSDPVVRRECPRGDRVGDRVCGCVARARGGSLLHLRNQGHGGDRRRIGWADVLVGRRRWPHPIPRWMEPVGLRAADAREDGELGADQEPLSLNRGLAKPARSVRSAVLA